MPAQRGVREKRGEWERSECQRSECQRQPHRGSVGELRRTQGVTRGGPRGGTNRDLQATFINLNRDPPDEMFNNPRGLITGGGDY